MGTITTIFLGLYVGLILAASLSGDWRLRFGTLAVVLAWAGGMFAGNPPPVWFDLVISFILINVFGYMLDQRDGEKTAYWWPWICMGIEALLFISHAIQLLGWRPDRWFILFVAAFVFIEVLVMYVAAGQRFIERLGRKDGPPSPDRETHSHNAAYLPRWLTAGRLVRADQSPIAKAVMTYLEMISTAIRRRP
ncbi:hypothetical protein FF098_014680 [Parvularcula flava]|uniref:Uncharacterized protein n=1 Tax=Aquisalinus luteolus TaxID=1566827 RepID=A0A8J3ES69_9PROT|nr:hypothetical protein [Aquisalinus luteolus]NHK29163.1 hypothetical protein [Aquisalinus luteolus]GGI00113.1 hypothetical protein GCM10011355_27640 [Aquisalinus luteolus]